MTQERRTDTRVSINLPVRWEGLSGGHEARISDIGLGGCFVNTLARVDVGEIVALEIQLPSGEWLQLSGEVTSFHNAVGFGLQFSGLAEDDESALNEVVGR